MGLRPLAASMMRAEFAVCRLPAEAAIPAWATASAPFCVMRTNDELSIVCEAERVPDGVKHERGWNALKLHGPFDFGETGILASVLSPLAAAKVSIFAVSTYDTDYVLLKAPQVERAISALRDAGIVVDE